MKKFVSLFLVFLLCFNIISLNLSNAENKQSLTLNDNIESQLSEESEIQPDPKENSNYIIMGGNSSENNSSLPIITKRAQSRLSSNAIGSGIIANTNILNVRSGPSTSYPKIGSLSKNDSIEIYARSNGWYKILYNNKFGYISSSYVDLDAFEKGIDVSKWNTVVDWNKVKSSGVDYVIIRAGFGTSTVDEKFKSHIEGAISAGLKIGVYWFSYATSVEKAQIEAQKCLETISPYKDKISYPVYFDYEYASVDYATKNNITISKDLASQMADAFINTIKASGYDTGIYTNQDFSNKYFNSELLYSNNLWIAQYNNRCTFNKPYNVWQCSDKGSVDGINGNVDINYTYLKSLNSNYTSDSPPDSSNDSNINTNTSISYRAHVASYEWLDWKSDGQLAGTTGESRQLEAIEIKLNNAPSNARILYQTHSAGYEWLGWKSNGETSGTTGEGKRAEAVRIKLENMPGYSIKYRVYAAGYGWLDWKSDGQIAGTTGQARQIEAIQIKLVKSDTISLSYRAHVAGYEWLDWQPSGETAGTTGQSRQLEAIELKLNNAPSNAKITYQTHVAGYEWLDWKSNGKTSGTTGQGRRAEAIRIKLENMPGYSIQYRVYVAGYGWLDWKFDGEIAGTTGQGRQIEAIEVKLVEVSLSYRAHVAGYEWLSWKSNTQLAGTTGEARQLEAIQIKLVNAPSDAEILYQTHVAGYEWLDWKSNGEISGTTGQGRRAEAIRIKLKNMPGYSIKYRVHVAGYEWLDWKSDGEIAGTTGEARRIEAIEIKLVKN